MGDDGLPAGGVGFTPPERAHVRVVGVRGGGGGVILSWRNAMQTVSELGCCREDLVSASVGSTRGCVFVCVM
jgi:hypothetical protein